MILISERYAKLCNSSEPICNFASSTSVGGVEADRANLEECEVAADGDGAEKFHVASRLRSGCAALLDEAGAPARAISSLWRSSSN